MTVSTRVVAAIVAASGLGAAASAQAQSVQLYGLLDLSVGQFQRAGQAKTKQLSSGEYSQSYFGFSGKEDVGGGLSVVFALESFLRPDTGAAGRESLGAAANADVFWGRTASVGLSGNFGTTRLGRLTTPLFASTQAFNPFGDSFGFSPSIRHHFGSALLGDRAWSNSLQYTSPKVGAATIQLQGSLGERSAKSVGRNVGANIVHVAGPLAATVAWQRVKNDHDLRFGTTLPPGFVDQVAYQFGATYDFGPVKWFGQYGRVRTDATVDVKARITQIGAGVPIGSGRLLASHGQLRYSGGIGATSKITTVGYDHSLSKRTDLYAVYMRDQTTGLNSGNSYAAGIRHLF
jgi:predicted porin